MEQEYDDSDNKCASKAKVIVKAKDESPNIVWIQAVDKETKKVLKCESKVARLSKIQIHTKMRTIDVGDYETLDILGYDSKGNTFTTLEGLRFNWTI